MKIIFLAAALVLSAGALRAQVINYTEAGSGDLSNLPASPTFLNFAPGLNTVAGTMGRPPGGAVDRDIFTFHVESWEQVTSIRVLDFNPTIAPGPTGSFLAISGANTISTTNPGTHLSNILIGGTGEILPLLAAGSYSDSLGNQPLTQGLSAPLGAGDYTIWFQELTTTVNYRLGVTVTAVPEPSTYAIAGSLLLLGICFVSRKKTMAVH